jgi:hypothetical protein
MKNVLLKYFFVSFILLLLLEVAPWASSSEVLFTPLLSGTGLHWRGGFVASFVPPVEFITVHLLIRLVWTRYPSQSCSLGTNIVRHEGESPCTDAPPIPGCTKARKSSCCCVMAPAWWTDFMPTPRPPLCSTSMVLWPKPTCAP